MKKMITISSLLLSVVFLTGCSLPPASRTQSTTPATSSSAQQNNNSCPEWIDCMPGPNRSECKIPKGCEDITQIAW